MADVVVVKGEDDNSVTREEAHEIAESHANDADERAAERDTHLAGMLGDALNPLSDRITALEQRAAEPVAVPVVEEATESVPETAAENDAETAASDAETAVEDLPDDVEHAEHEATETVPDKDAKPDDDEPTSGKKSSRRQRDRTPRQRRGFLTTVLGGSGGVRRGK